MIKINLSPVCTGIKIELSASGSVVTLNGIDYDLSLLEDSASGRWK